MGHIQTYLHRIPRRLWLIPPVVWMACIFFLSSRQGISVSDEYWMNFAVFKLLHVIEYAILTILNTLALVSNLRSVKLRDAVAYSAGIALLYAMSDEIHQTFVPTREGRLRDVLIDSMGIISVYWFASRYEKKFTKILSSFLRPWTS